MGPGVFGAGVTQLNLLISTALASLLPGGSVSYLYYADRLNQLPLGVVGIAIGTAILPPLSRQVRTGDAAGAAATQNRGIELALLLTLPAAAGLVVLAQPILSVLFERGAFGPTEAAATAAALAGYAIGLPAFVLVKVLAPGFFAHRNTATPVRVAVGAMVLNLRLDRRVDAGSGPCRGGARLVGVGLDAGADAAGAACAATAISGSIGGSRAIFRGSRRRRSAWRRSSGGCAMPSPPALAGPPLLRLAALAGLIAAGAVVFAVLILAFGVTDWRELRGQLRRQPA